MARPSLYVKSTTRDFAGTEKHRISQDLSAPSFDSGQKLARNSGQVRCQNLIASQSDIIIQSFSWIWVMLRMQIMPTQEWFISKHYPDRATPYSSLDLRTVLSILLALAGYILLLMGFRVRESRL